MIPAPGIARARRTGRWTRVRALLAGALVLGAGTTLTLASWTDTEYASGAFAASTFGIVGSTDGTTFADHPSGSAAALSFTVSPAALSPGTTVYAGYTVKSTATTNVTGTVSLGGAVVGGSGLDAYLVYGVKVVSGTTCSSASYAASSTVVVAAGSALTTAGTASRALAAGGGSPVTYCFAVTLSSSAPNDAQGRTATVTWTFTAASDS